MKMTTQSPNPWPAVLAAGYFKRRIAGYTGDCLGAVQQVTELTFLMVALAALMRTPDFA